MTRVPVPREGEAWRGSRRVLARGLLSPGAAEAFAGPVATVVAELVARLQRLRRQHPRGIVPDIGTEFNRFGLEGERGPPRGMGHPKGL